jgi:hypothetical protein
MKKQALKKIPSREDAAAYITQAADPNNVSKLVRKASSTLSESSSQGFGFGS